MARYIPHGDELLQVFEEHYGSHNHDGFWGPVTASIDWCERNYVVSFFVAEWYNTVSNSLLVFCSVVGLLHALQRRRETRHVVLHAACMLVAVGSTVFHGTLSHIGQQGDETPMMYAICTWIYCLWNMDPAYERAHPRSRRMVLWGLLGWCCIFTPLHYRYRFVVSFQVLFAALTLYASRWLIFHIRRTQIAAARRLGILYIVCMVVGFSLWLIDVHHCDAMHALPVGNPQFHAWWHVFTGIACYCGPAFLSFRRLEMQGQRPTLLWRFFVPVPETKQVR